MYEKARCWECWMISTLDGMTHFVNAGAAADRGDEKAVQDLRTLEEMIRAAYARFASSRE